MSRFPQSSCSKFGAAIFLAREEQKFARLPPLCGGNGTSTQFLAAKSEILEGKAFFWYLVYHIAFSFRKIRRLWKSTSTPSISSEISGSSGLLKVIYLSLLPPTQTDSWSPFLSIAKYKYNCVILAQEEIITSGSISQISSIILTSQYRSKVLLFSLKSHVDSLGWFKIWFLSSC